MYKSDEITKIQIPNIEEATRTRLNSTVYQKMNFCEDKTFGGFGNTKVYSLLMLTLN